MKRRIKIKNVKKVIGKKSPSFMRYFFLKVDYQEEDGQFVLYEKVRILTIGFTLLIQMCFALIYGIPIVVTSCCKFVSKLIHGGVINKYYLTEKERKKLLGEDM